MARIGTTATTSALPAGGPAVTSVSGLASAQLAFARCMRAHGVLGFPDPNGRGSFSVPKAEARGGLNVNSSEFQGAQRACRGLLPSGGHASPAQQAAASTKTLEFAQCMHTHGVPDFPDPGTRANWGYFVQAQSGPLSPSNPQFARAQKTCQKSAGGTY